MVDVRLPASMRAFRHRNYQLFFAGQLVSLSGTWMQSVAQSWLVYRLTGSAILLGLVGFASQIPVFILAPIGGGFADRKSRHRIIIVTQIVAMVPDSLRGRVMAVYSMMFMGMAPIGALVAGSLAHRLGAPRTVLRGGIVCMFGAAIFALRLPKLRDEGRRLIVSLQMTGGSPAAEATGEASAMTEDDGQ